VPRVCLITPGHLASTPRVLKEADALAAAGYDTHVVSGRHFGPGDPLDEEILARAAWRSMRVDFRDGRPGVLRRKILRRLARKLLSAVHAPSLAARAHHAETFTLAHAAASLGADLYLGHCLAGLPAAALAARAAGTRYGFDIEDFHDAETHEAATNPAERRIRRILQQTFLPNCASLTAAAPLIARATADAYGVNAQVILNVFPRSHAPAEPLMPAPITDARPARIYWFSQTVGPGRGLETMVEVLAHMRTPAELALRGFSAPDYRAELSARAARAGLRRPIQFLDPAPAGEMVRLAATADLGLSIEETSPRNRDLCLTNKLFVYLLAGIPQLLSNTRAQTMFAPEVGAAGLLADPNQIDETARTLDAFFGNPTRLAESRAAAWRLGQEKFCWDVEQYAFLNVVEQALGASRGHG